MSARDERMKMEAKRIVELIIGGSVYGHPIGDWANDIVDLDDINAATFICAIYGAAQLEDKGWGTSLHELTGYEIDNVRPVSYDQT